MLLNAFNQAQHQTQQVWATLPMGASAATQDCRLDEISGLD